VYIAFASIIKTLENIPTKILWKRYLK
jgi:hypothetical protein